MSAKWLFSLLACLLFIAFAMPGRTAPAAADGTTWRSIGPYGGRISHVTVSPHNPAVLYARGRAGILVSRNGGENWELLEDWYDAPGRFPVAVDPRNPDHLYAPFWSTSDNSLLESHDGGETWNEVPSPFDVEQVVFHPTAEGTLYARTPEGLYRTVDGGAEWQLLPASGARSFLIHSTMPNVLYATNFSSSFRSTDGGDSWEEYSGSPSHLLLAAISPLDGTLYGYTDYEFSAGRIYRSHNGGQTWEEFSSGLPPTDDYPRIDDLVIDPTDPTRLYAAIFDYDDNPSTYSTVVYRTTGGEPAWETTATDHGWNGDPQGGGLAVAATKPTTVYLGLDGISKSTDFGTSWTPANEGIPGRFLSDLEADPQDSDRLYAAGGLDLYRTADGGATWTVTRPYTQTSAIEAIAVAPSDPETLLIATDYHGTYRSRDRGDTWEPVNDGLPLDAVLDFDFDPMTAQNVLALVDGGRIYRSTTGGDTWTLSHDQFSGIYDVAYSTISPTLVWAGGDDLFLKSVNGGASFTEVETSGLPTDYFIHDIAVHPTDDDILYVGTHAPRYVYRSVDGGATWTPLDTGVVGSIRAFDVWLDPNTPTTLYVALNVVDGYGFIQNPLGIRRSTDGGDSWEPFDSGLTYPAVTDLSGSGTRIYANTFGGSVWAYGDAPPGIRLYLPVAQNENSGY